MPKSMRVVEVHFDDGDIIRTCINGTDLEINDYYLGKDLVKRDEVTMHKAIYVKFVA
jgi:hypothetical protein